MSKGSNTNYRSSCWEELWTLRTMILIQSSCWTMERAPLLSTTGDMMLVLFFFNLIVINIEFLMDL